MRKLLKGMLVILTMCSIVVGGNCSTVKAEEMDSKVYFYDMEQGKKETFTIEDSKGEKIVVTIEEIPTISRALENRTYKISFTSPLAWKASHNVVIKNNRISSVNSPKYTAYAGSISSCVLKKDSSTQATMSFIYKIGGLNTRAGMRTNIVNNQLKVTGI